MLADVHFHRSEYWLPWYVSVCPLAAIGLFLLCECLCCVRQLTQYCLVLLSYRDISFVTAQLQLGFD